MTAPTDLVSISQSELNGFADTISRAVGILGPYITQLLAGQPVQLQPADVSQVQEQLDALQNLEAPAVNPTPAPSSDTPPSTDTPPSDPTTDPSTDTPPSV